MNFTVLKNEMDSDDDADSTEDINDLQKIFFKYSEYKDSINDFNTEITNNFTNNLPNEDGYTLGEDLSTLNNSDVFTVVFADLKTKYDLFIIALTNYTKKEEEAAAAEAALEARANAVKNFLGDKRP